jgi:ABC-type transporter Mla subunit MlaD
VIGCVALSACTDIKDDSLCVVFDEYLNSRATVEALLQQVDTLELNAAQATDIAENHLANVRRMREAADGRYGQDLENLQNAVEDILRTLASVQDDAEIDTWLPLVEEDIEDAQELGNQVVEAIAPSCEPTASLQEVSGT